jgi:hypothetical protein
MSSSFFGRACLLDAPKLGESRHALTKKKTPHSGVYCLFVCAQTGAQRLKRKSRWLAMPLGVRPQKNLKNEQHKKINFFTYVNQS